MSKVYASINLSLDPSNLPPQAQAIVEEVRAKSAVSRDELLGALDRRFADHYRQSGKTVLSFYRARLLSEGFMVEYSAG